MADNEINDINEVVKENTIEENITENNVVEENITDENDVDKNEIEVNNNVVDNEGKEDSVKVTNEVVRDTAGIVGRDHLFNLCDSIKDKDSTIIITIRKTAVSCSDTKFLIISTSEVQRWMISPVWFFMCQENGRR